MPVLGRRRRRHRLPAGVAGPPRRTVTVVLPAAPGAPFAPRPLELTVPADGRSWRLPPDAPAAPELAAFLATLDVAPPGAVLDLGAGPGEHALLAAVYSRRLVRAVERDPVLAHATRQTAATNALPVVVEERRLAPASTTGGIDAGGETVDAYLARTALEPAVLRFGVDDALGLVAGAVDALRRIRPWLVLRTTRTAEALLDQVPDLVAVGYRLTTDTDSAAGSAGYVLAPEAVGSAFWRRVDAWSAALLRPVEPARPEPPAAATAAVDVRAADRATRSTS